MINLLVETQDAIRRSGHEIGDVEAVVRKGGRLSCDWATFIGLADFEYDEGFGLNEVALDLAVVFSDGRTMWRHEYDGAERWEYDTLIEIHAGSEPLTAVREEYD